MKPFTWALAILLALSMTQAPSPARALSVNSQAERLTNFSELSPQEIHEGLQEINQSLVILRSDLTAGKETKDHRFFMVKARNISLKVAGMSVLAAMGFLVGVGSQQAVAHVGLGVGLGISLAVLLGSAATSAIIEGHLYLTKSELTLLSEKIERIERLVVHIQQRLEL